MNLEIPVATEISGSSELSVAAEVPIASEIQLEVVIANPVAVNRRQFRYDDRGREISFLVCICIVFFVCYLSYM